MRFRLKVGHVITKRLKKSWGDEEPVVQEWAAHPVPFVETYGEWLKQLPAIVVSFVSSSGS